MRASNPPEPTNRYGSVYVVAALALIGTYVVYQAWFNETRKVLRRLRQIEIALTAPPREPDVERFTRIARLRQYLAPEVRIQAGPSSAEIASRDALLSAVSAWKPPAAGIEVHFVEVQIRIEDDRTRAMALVTVEIDAHEEPSTSSEPDSTAATVTLEKRQGEWVVTTAAMRENPVRRRSSDGRHDPGSVLALVQRDDQRSLHDFPGR